MLAVITLEKYIFFNKWRKRLFDTLIYDSVHVWNQTSKRGPAWLFYPGGDDPRTR